MASNGMAGPLAISGCPMYLPCMGSDLDEGLEAATPALPVDRLL